MLAYTSARLTVRHTPPTPDEITARKHKLWADLVRHLANPISPVGARSPACTGRGHQPQQPGEPQP